MVTSKVIRALPSFVGLKTYFQLLIVIAILSSLFSCATMDFETPSMLKSGQFSHGGGVNFNLVGRVSAFSSDYIFFHRIGINEYLNLGVSYRAIPSIIYWPEINLEFVPTFSLKATFTTNRFKPVLIAEVGPDIFIGSNSVSPIKVPLLKNAVSVLVGIEELYGGLRAEIYWRTNDPTNVVAQSFISIVLGATLFSKNSLKLIPQIQIISPFDFRVPANSFFSYYGHWVFNLGIGLKYEVPVKKKGEQKW